jgi:hypothetical protein
MVGKTGDAHQIIGAVNLAKRSPNDRRPQRDAPKALSDRPTVELQPFCATSMSSTNEARSSFSGDRLSVSAALGGRAARFAAVLLALSLFGSLRAAEDDEDEEDKTPPLPKEVAELARKYAGVTEWQGFFDSSRTEVSTRSGATYSRSRHAEARTHGRFTMPRSDWGWDPRAGNFRWGGNNRIQCGEATGSRFEQFSARDDDGTFEEWTSELGGTVPMFAVSFDLNLTKQTGGVHMGFMPDEKSPTRRQTGNAVYQMSSGDGQRRYGTKVINEVGKGSLDVPHIRTGFAIDRDYATREWNTVRNGPGVLTFTYERTAAMTNNTPGQVHRSRIILFPVYDDLELEVTIEGYATWRPEGSIEKPQEPGNSLVARATLKSKKGNVKELPAVKRFRFELLDTSREPGICLNWPLKAKDEDYDLRLTAENGGKLSEMDQKLVVTDVPKDEKEQPYAETKINSYDFGGRATLQVICELEDGRELLGVIKDEKGEQDLVRLPKMDGPDWVAENWRKEKKAEKLPAIDDTEKVDGQEYKGDGFTLYEEYRGWVEKGKHIEGDPLKKDFFVRNTIGADAKGGIALFGRVSKLRVHSELRASEIVVLGKITDETESKAAGERIMNLNRREGPHRVQQHAVVLINTRGYGSRGGGTDAVADGDKTNRAFRPAKVQAIHLEDRDRANGIFSRKASIAEYNLSEREAAVVYDRAVAHELLHSVGVDHHGEGESAKMFYFQGAADPMNTLHRPRFVPYMPFSADEYGKRQQGRPPVWSDFDRGETLVLKWEDTGEDVAQSLSANFERELTAERGDPYYERYGAEQAARYPQYGKDALFWSEMAIYDAVSGGYTKRGLLNVEAHRFNRLVTIGREHEADSGHELCLMRYYFANAYPVDGTENTFYLVRPGTNRAGTELCRSPEGTGANAHDHKPKSRFGDAAPGRGNCFKYICPNDAIPPRKL